MIKSHDQMLSEAEDVLATAATDHARRASIDVAVHVATNAAVERFAALGMAGGLAAANNVLVVLARRWGLPKACVVDMLREVLEIGGVL